MRPISLASVAVAALASGRWPRLATRHIPIVMTRTAFPLTRALLALSLLVLPARALRAQYGFAYAVWQNYFAIGDGSPYSGQLCTGTTAVINYDNNPLTNNPKISSWCAAVGPGD